MTIQLSFRPQALLLVVVFSVLLAYSGSLVLQIAGVLYDHDSIFGILPLLNIDREGNIAAWLSSTTMLICAIVAWSLATPPGVAQPTDSGAWKSFAAVLFLMSMDEASQIHEWLGSRIQPLLPQWGPLYFGWVVLGGAAALVLAPLFIRFVRGLPRRTRLHLSAAAVVFLAGAIGAEMVTANYMSITEDKLSIQYIVLSHIEEFLEMLGLIILLKGLLEHAGAAGKIKPLVGRVDTAIQAAVVH